MKPTTKPLLIAFGVFAVTFLAAVALSQFGKQQGWFGAPAAAPSPIVSSAPYALPGRPARPVAAPQSVDWQRASIIVGGQRYALDGPSISLPTGTRFRVELQGLPAGTVEVYAVNPEGRTSGASLWTQGVGQSGLAVSPDLRLQGKKGMETLEIVHRGAAGVTQRRVALWHL